MSYKSFLNYRSLLTALPLIGMACAGSRTTYPDTSCDLHHRNGDTTFVIVEYKEERMLQFQDMGNNGSLDAIFSYDWDDMEMDTVRVIVDEGNLTFDYLFGHDDLTFEKYTRGSLAADSLQILFNSEKAKCKTVTPVDVVY